MNEYELYKSGNYQACFSLLYQKTLRAKVFLWSLIALTFIPGFTAINLSYTCNIAGCISSVDIAAVTGAVVIVTGTLTIVTIAIISRTVVASTMFAAVSIAAATATVAVAGAVAAAAAFVVVASTGATGTIGAVFIAASAIAAITTTAAVAGGAVSSRNVATVLVKLSCRLLLLKNGAEAGK